ncbi:MAG: hypothetical protein IKN83_10190 [Bacteroidaceae bacterium]|nr:hypothetical protein [Bacteroidaceae bacterium]
MYTYQTSYAGYIVTAPVIGEVSFYVRARATRKACGVKVFKYGDSGVGEEITAAAKSYTSSNTNTSWSQVTFNLTEGTRLAFQLNNAAIDDFVAEAYEDGAEKKAIGISAFAADETNLNTDTEGKYTASFTVTVENKGNVALTAEDNATVSLLDANKNVIATSDAIELAKDGSTEITLTYKGTATADGDITFYVKENMTDKQFATSATVNVRLAGARFVIDNDGSAQDFGFNAIDGTSEKSYAVTNNGNITMNVTIAAPEGYAVNPSTFTVEAGTNESFTVSLNTATVGIKAGDVVVTSDAVDVQSFNIPVSGYVYADGVEHVDFSALPQGWTIAGNTSISDGIADFYYSESNTMETPAIEFAEGGVLAIRGMLRSSSGKLTVKGSTDGGSTWSYSKAVTGFNDNTYTTVELTDIPADVNKLQFVGYYFYIDDLAGFNYDQNAPVLTVDPTTDAAFGKMKASDSKTYTITNSGTGTLTGTITSSDETKFSVSESEFNLGAGESMAFDVILVFDENYGEKSATISVVPSYDETAAVVINATATTSDPNVWEEDFEEGTVPARWIVNGWTVTNSGYGINGTYMLAAGQSTTVAITPRLYAEKDQVLTFEVGGADSSDPLTVKWASSNDAAEDEWNLIGVITTTGEQSFTAPETGFYYISFQGKYSSVDNFEGFKLDLPAHEAAITATTIPATGTQFAEYTASVTVKEQAGKSEELTAIFFIGETQYGEDVVETVNANGTKTFTVTFTPEEAISGDAYFTVTNDDITLTSEKKAVEIAPAPVLDETAASVITTGTVDALVLKYTPKNGWNTICVPFALTDDILTQIFGEGWKAYEFKGYNDGEFTFYKPSFYAAGYPYLVFTENAQVATDGYKLENINITAATALSDNYGGVTLQGTYAPMAAGTMEGKYGVVPNNNDVPTIMKGGASATLKGYRGYFEIPASSGVKSFSFTFVDDATGIRQFVATPDNGAIYDLNGNKVKNLVKGQVYIMNGQKILVK